MVFTSPSCPSSVYLSYYLLPEKINMKTVSIKIYPITGPLLVSFEYKNFNIRFSSRKPLPQDLQQSLVDTQNWNKTILDINKNKLIIFSTNHPIIYLSIQAHSSWGWNQFNLGWKKFYQTIVPQFSKYTFKKNNQI